MLISAKVEPPAIPYDGVQIFSAPVQDIQVGKPPVANQRDEALVDRRGHFGHRQITNRSPGGQQHGSHRQQARADLCQTRVADFVFGMQQDRRSQFGEVLGCGPRMAGGLPIGGFFGTWGASPLAADFPPPAYLRADSPSRGE